MPKMPDTPESFIAFRETFVVAVNRLEEASRVSAIAVSLTRDEYNAILIGLMLLDNRQTQGKGSN